MKVTRSSQPSAASSWSISGAWRWPSTRVGRDVLVDRHEVRASRSPRGRRPRRRSWRRRPRPRSVPRARAARAPGSPPSSSSRGSPPGRAAAISSRCSSVSPKTASPSSAGAPCAPYQRSCRRRGRASRKSADRSTTRSPRSRSGATTPARGAVRIGDERDVGRSRQALGVERLQLQRHAVARVEIVQPPARLAARGDGLERDARMRQRIAAASAPAKPDAPTTQARATGSPASGCARRLRSARLYSRRLPPISRASASLDPLAPTRPPRRR